MATHIFRQFISPARENNIKVFHKPGRINLPRASCLRLYANYYANCIFLFHESINYLSRSHALSTFSAPDGTSVWRTPLHSGAAKSNCCVISPFERTSKSPSNCVSAPNTIKWLMRQLIWRSAIISLCDQTDSSAPRSREQFIILTVL